MALTTALAKTAKTRIRHHPSNDGKNNHSSNSSSHIINGSNKQVKSKSSSGAVNNSKSNYNSSGRKAEGLPSRSSKGVLILNDVHVMLIITAALFLESALHSLAHLTDVHTALSFSPFLCHLPPSLSLSLALVLSLSVLPLSALIVSCPLPISALDCLSVAMSHFWRSCFHNCCCGCCHCFLAAVVVVLPIPATLAK